MSITTGAGARFYIGTTTTQTTQIGYEGESWTEVGQVEEIGEFGDEATDVTATVLGDRRTRHLKGSVDGGALVVTCLHDDTDTGQAAMITARATDFNYNFKVEIDDPRSLSGTGTTYYFHGLVMSDRINIGNSDNVVRIAFNVGINSEFVKVASAA